MGSDEDVDDDGASDDGRALGEQRASRRRRLVAATMNRCSLVNNKFQLTWRRAPVAGAANVSS